MYKTTAVVDNQLVQDLHDAIYEYDCPISKYQLALRYLEGKDVERDETEAIALLESSVKTDYSDAQNMLGVFLMTGDVVSINKERAAALFQKAAAQGNRDALFNLGLCCETGSGIKKSKPFAARYYKEAAQLGCVDSQNKIGLYLLEQLGFDIQKKDVAMIRVDTEEALANTANNIGLHLSKGPDFEAAQKAEAAQWFFKAAEAGDANARFNLAFCYENGIGVATNAKEAAKLRVMANKTAVPRSIIKTSKSASAAASIAARSSSSRRG